MPTPPALRAISSFAICRISLTLLGGAAFQSSKLDSSQGLDDFDIDIGVGLGMLGAPLRKIT